MVLLCNFVASLYQKGYSPSSIAGHMSAISYVHKLLDIPDPTQSFLIRKLLKGAQNLSKAPDTRMPITKQLLHQILSSLNHTAGTAIERHLLQSLFSLAFHGFFRLGELIPKTAANVDRVLQVQNVSVLPHSKADLTLKFFKNNTSNKPFTISILAVPSSQFCPVTLLSQYLSVCPHSCGPLYQFPSGQPATYSYVVYQLRLALKFAGLDTSLYKGHSFRIGAATEAASNGYSENAIQKMGRWNSNAVRRYIRIACFTS